MQIISADDHMDLHSWPPDLFARRLPAAVRDEAPRVVQGPDGPMWMVEDTPLGPSGRSISSLKLGLPDTGFRPSTPALRLEDMDLDGIQTQVIYGPPRGFSLKNKRVASACMQAYNDWGVEFNRADPQRLCLLAMLPAHDPEAAAAEVRRVAASGHRGAQFNIFEPGKPPFDPYWEPFWEAAEETGLPISFHLSGGTYSLFSRPGSWEMPAFVTIAPMQLDEAMVGMVFSGALERHPGLRIVLGESGIGWVPYVVQRMDHEYRKYNARTQDYQLRREPSAIFHDQVFLTYEDDPLGVSLIPLFGEDNVMWASDYPHPDSTFPNSRKVIEEQFAGVGAAIKQKVCYENAARLYGFD
jgi:predicted TIM-barrel fold metal-dependent hydrolase